MPISVEQDDTRFQVRLEGEIGLGEAVELKRTLLEGLASGRKLHLDMECAGAIDVTFMQLLQSALREARGAGTGIALNLSGAAENALRNAGFRPLVEAAAWSG